MRAVIHTPRYTPLASVCKRATIPMSAVEKDTVRPFSLYSPGRIYKQAKGGERNATSSPHNAE